MMYAIMRLMGCAASTSNNRNHIFFTKVDADSCEPAIAVQRSVRHIQPCNVSAWFVFYQVIVTVVCTHQLFCFGAAVTKVGGYVV